jgi:hypothetical protein
MPNKDKTVVPLFTFFGQAMDYLGKLVFLGKAPAHPIIRAKEAYDAKSASEINDFWAESPLAQERSLQASFIGKAPGLLPAPF